MSKVKQLIAMVNPRAETDRDDASAERPYYGDVVKLVRTLGAEALGQFVDGLAPHFDAVQRRDDQALDDLAWYLHEWAVTAAVVKDAGGLDAYMESSRSAAEGEAVSIDDAIARLEGLST